MGRAFLFCVSGYASPKHTNTASGVVGPLPLLMKKKSDTSAPQAGEKPRQQTAPPHKRQGEVAELAFMHKAAKLGFGVTKPYGDSERYDFILDSGRHLWRVQVKSTQAMSDNAYCLNTHHSVARHKGTYNAEQVDFLVAYVVPRDVWYVIPVHAVGSHLAIRLFPHRTPKRGGQFERYREAWCLMACQRDGKLRDQIVVEPYCASQVPGSECPGLDHSAGGDARGVNRPRKKPGHAGRAPDGISQQVKPHSE
jgi:hypothetical protein